MNKNKLLSQIIVFFVFFNSNIPAYSKIMKMTKCKNLKDGFIKNEYILDFEKSLVTRNYVYDSKTYKKHRTTDLSIQKENSIERFIYKDKNLILTDKIGYPQFYTQLVFEKNNPNIKIKTVINNEEAIEKISTCGSVEIFDKES
jgi:hypothetical protein